METKGLKALIRAPLLADEEALRKSLSVYGLEVGVFSFTEVTAVDLDASIIICTQEGLTERFLAWVHRVNSDIQPWQQVPLILILDRKITSAEIRFSLGTLLDAAAVTILRRPVRATDFQSALARVSEGRVRQQMLRQHLTAQEELTNEINHRLKNTLTTVMALYRMSLKQSVDLVDFDQRFSSRLGALNSVQELLRAASNGHRTITAIASAILSPYAGAERISIAPMSQVLSRQAALTVALILNELATNVTLPPTGTRS